MTRKIFCSRTLAVAMQFGFLASYLQWLETCAKIITFCWFSVTYAVIDLHYGYDNLYIFFILLQT